MQARYIIITALLVAAVVAVCGCSTVTPTATPATPTPAPSSQYPMTITDSFGQTATLQKAPQRIVSLSPVNTEILFDLGLGDKIVGNTEFCDYPAAAANIAHVAGYNTVSAEKVAAVNPDLIFGEDIQEEGIKLLRTMGYPAIELKTRNITSLTNNIMIMGRATGTESAASNLSNNITTRIDALRIKAAGINESQKPTVLLLLGVSAEPTLYPFCGGSTGDELLNLVGAKNIAGNMSEWSIISKEAIIQQDPDIIIVAVDSFSEPYYGGFRNGTWGWTNDLKAFKSGNVYSVDANIINRPGPRLADAGEIIARIVHPGLFQ